jgi:hypothetical protein
MSLGSPRPAPEQWKHLLFPVLRRVALHERLDGTKSKASQFPVPLAETVQACLSTETSALSGNFNVLAIHEGVLRRSI